ncbi:MAG: hypothetical protein RJA22_2338 [Verrucomicrobiota bacterium]|jgi:hypothetical protein
MFPMQSPRFLAVWPLLSLLFLSAPVQAAQPMPVERASWWRGNLHTHSLWSDGDDFPEMITEWYATNGYHFLGISDHNILQQGERWVAATGEVRRKAIARCLARHGTNWLAWRTVSGNPQVRLKTLEEYRGLFERRDRFLLLTAEEITDRYRRHEIHMNATNLRDYIKPRGGTSVVDVLQRNLDAVLDQRLRTGQPMLPHINHPNFGWSITAEDLMPLRGARFFEVYNGHPSVYNEGDAQHPGLERLWDIALAFRLSELRLGPLYGLATDDAHRYHQYSAKESNPGRGWIQVRAPRLWASSLIKAMEAGDFYASTGVRLRDVRRSGRGLSLEIEPEAGVEYTTRFIGTLRGFDPTSRPGSLPAGTNALPVTRIYSPDIGAVLAEVRGPRAEYRFTGDELYVRATVVSSKAKANGIVTNEVERAWVQPVVPSARGR